MLFVHTYVVHGKVTIFGDILLENGNKTAYSVHRDRQISLSLEQPSISDASKRREFNNEVEDAII